MRYKMPTGSRKVVLRITINPTVKFLSFYFYSSNYPHNVIPRVAKKIAMAQY